MDGYNLRVLISLRQLNFSELSLRNHPALNPRSLPIEESIDEISGIHPTRHFCTLVVNKPYLAPAGALVSATVACWKRSSSRGTPHRASEGSGTDLSEALKVSPAT